jgi:hypothetical protein
MAITKITGASIAADSIDGTKIADDAINSEHITDGGIDDVHIGDLAATKLTGTIASGRLSASNLGSGTVPTARLGSGTADTTKFLRGDGSWQVVSIPKLDSPTITGTLTVNASESVSHTISNWSDDVSYTITPTNCTVGSVNSSGVFVVTHTSGAPSYTIVATTTSLGLDDSTTVTKNILLNLTAPTLSSPADVLSNGTSTDVTYTVTSTDSNDDQIILNLGSSNFTLQSTTGGTGTKTGNTVVVTSFSTNNPVIVVRFTAEATYSVTAQSKNLASAYGDSALSAADSIQISNGIDLLTASNYTTYFPGATSLEVGTYRGVRYETAGTYNVTMPGGQTSIRVWLVGGGGGVGNCSNNNTGGAGGGGVVGNYTVVAGTTLNITVGANGSANSGGTAGSSSFGVGGTNYATANGGGNATCGNNPSGGTFSLNTPSGDTAYGGNGGAGVSVGEGTAGAGNWPTAAGGGCDHCSRGSYPGDGKAYGGTGGDGGCNAYGTAGTYAGLTGEHHWTQAYDGSEGTESNYGGGGSADGGESNGKPGVVVIQWGAGKRAYTT